MDSVAKKTGRRQPQVDLSAMGWFADRHRPRIDVASLLLMVCEIAHAPRKIHRTNWRRHYYIPDRARVVRHGIDSRPQIFVTGHFGNFELYGYIAGKFGYQSSTIARPLDNRFVHDYSWSFVL